MNLYEYDYEFMNMNDITMNDSELNELNFLKAALFMNLTDTFFFS